MNRFGSLIPPLLMILFRQKYPRWWFDFNLELLRFQNRVGVYVALMDDRYPSTDEQQSLRLDIAYPDARTELNRWLPLVKWLLAIPHYLVLAFFAGGGVYLANEATRSDQSYLNWGSGLIGLLVLFAAVVLLVTGRYPQSIYDLVLGMNRWMLRVAAYAGLMTDQYPPFRLDQGGDDPRSGRLTVDDEGSVNGTYLRIQTPRRLTAGSWSSFSGVWSSSSSRWRSCAGGWTTARWTVCGRSPTADVSTRSRAPSSRRNSRPRRTPSRFSRG